MEIGKLKNGKTGGWRDYSISFYFLLISFSFPLTPLASENNTVTVERHLGMMGTSLTIFVEAVDRPTALAASERAVRALSEAEERLSTWRDDTELARFNRSDVGEPVILSLKLLRDLTAARFWWQKTNGAFDPGIGALVEAWGLRHNGRIPRAEALRKAMRSGGFSSFILEERTAIRNHEGLRIEEGGFGKGAGLDDAMAAVTGEGVLRATINLGGQIVMAGKNKPTSYEIAHPKYRNNTVLSLTVGYGALATSGNSERGIEVNGIRYSHILDPRCGQPAPDFGSMTVWASDALTADCLSTGLYVLGPDEALSWASAYPDIDILVLETTPNGLQARATTGLKDRITVIDDHVQLIFYAGSDQISHEGDEERQ